MPVKSKILICYDNFGSHNQCLYTCIFWTMYRLVGGFHISKVETTPTNSNFKDQKFPGQTAVELIQA